MPTQPRFTHSSLKCAVLFCFPLALGLAPCALADGPEATILSDPQVIIAEESRDRDWFGWAIDIHGNTAALSSVSGESPEVYLFDFDGTAWVKSATINPGLEAFRPYELALDGDILVIGMSSFDDPDICGTEQPNCNNGIALLYERDPAGSGEWVFRKSFMGNRVPDGGVGHSLKVDDDYLVISAFTEDGEDSVTASGSGPQSVSETVDNAGAVYIHERNKGGPGEWGLVQRIEQEVPYVDSFFGSDPLLAGDTLVLNEMRSGGYMTGVIIYERQPGDEGSWVMTQRIPLPSYRIGSLDFDGTTLVQTFFNETSKVNSYQFLERDETGQFVLMQEMERSREGLIGWGLLAIKHGQMVEIAGEGELVGRIFKRHPETGMWEETGELRYVGLNAPEPDRVRTLALSGGRLLVSTLREEYRGEVLAYEIAPAINAGHMGGWYNPLTPGQGVLVDVDEANDYLFGAWFTYTPETSAHPHEQHWFTAQEQFKGNKAKLVLYESLGGHLDDSAPVSTDPVGVATISFTDCASGMMSYRIDTLGISGVFPLVRLLPGTETTCQTRNEVAVQSMDINPGMNGGWYYDQTAGQGFLIDTLPDGAGGGFIFIAWFTYGDTTASGQRWLTAQGNFTGPTADIVIYESTGGSFDTPLLPSTDPVGSMQVDFTDCDTATFSYQLEEGPSGTIPLARLLPAGNALCKELTGGID